MASYIVEMLRFCKFLDSLFKIAGKAIARLQ
jgi:hypothetical protein